MKRDDVLVLSKFPITWQKLDGKKLGKFYSEICEQGAMVAYVTQAKPPKKIGMNYLSLIISGESFEDLSENVEELHCYRIESLLPEQR